MIIGLRAVAPLEALEDASVHVGRNAVALIGNPQLQPSVVGQVAAQNDDCMVMGVLASIDQ